MVIEYDGILGHLIETSYERCTEFFQFVNVGKIFRVIINIYKDRDPR